MDRQELIKYLNDVFELESQVYTYERIEQEYRKKTSPLCNTSYNHVNYEFYISVISCNYAQLVFPGTRVKFCKGVPGVNQTSAMRDDWKNTSEFQSLNNSYTKEGNSIKQKNRLTIFAIIALEAFVLFLGYLLYSNGVDSELFFGVLIVLLGLIPFKGHDICYDTFHKRERMHLQKYDALFKEYYNKCAAAENQRIIEEEKPLKNQLEQECSEFVTTHKNNAQKLLNKLYATNTIFPKYRNLVAVSQMYEYIASGRCSELEGPNGAYNLFESELRQNIIISKLDDIIKELRTLNSTMSTLCGMISTTNSMLSGISSSLGSIAANTAITAYNTQCIAYNTSISNRYY